ncbi:protein FAM200C-like [Cardiocondyla obscurior]|uniref:protein FAM200C-like n=1 Tax=Cardiocondyla obscurior TaxID=286306 RepID=UPI00396581E5
MALNEKGAIKKRRVKEFQYSWLDENIFKGWLAPYHQENKALCTACNKLIRCNKSDLVQHSQTVKHITNINLNNKIYNESPNDKVELNHKDKVKRAEIKLAAFFAEHNTAFSTADHLIPLLKDICLESKVIQNLKLGRNKCNEIVKHIIAKREVEKLINNLQFCKFSILIDESTDISDSKLMCVLAKYVSPNNGQVITQLLELVSLDARDCSANKLFKTFKDLLSEKKILITNIVGLACDNASVMTGCNNSFAQNLKLEVPNLIVLNCICHSSALVASKACQQIPSLCKNLIRNIYSYISGSAKRTAILQDFQDFFEVERNKLLKLSGTRWLVLHQCVLRILENWDVLKNYFILAVVEDKLQSADVILSSLNNNKIKAYFLFLKYVLNFFNNFNGLFQSRKILIHKLYVSSRQLIHQLAQNFMTVEALNNIKNININNDKQILNLENVYVGPECEKFLELLSHECRVDFKLVCLNFYKIAVLEMLKRLPYNDSIFQSLMFLDPKIALYNEGRTKFKDLTDIAAILVKDIDICKLAYEWRILPSIFDNEQKKELEILEIDIMWNKILNHINFNEEKTFQNLKFLVEIVLSFPHSNAEAERIFSMVTDIKCKKRNRLTNDNVSALCVVRSSFQADGINCTNFEIERRHLELHNSHNLYDSTSDEAE